MDFFSALFYIVIATVIFTAMQPKQKPPKAPAFEDFDFPQFEEGTPQCVIFGDCWTEDWMVLAVGNYRTTEIRKSA